MDEIAAWFQWLHKATGIRLTVFYDAYDRTRFVEGLLTTVKLSAAHGFAAPFVLTSVVLAAYGVTAMVLLRDAPDRQLPTESMTVRLAATLRDAGAPCLCDPAVYGGHREIDLAMMKLFGGFGPRVFAAYKEAWPLADGYRERVTLYQLYPLMVHVNLFGGGYVGSVEAALGRLV
jgi:hypothetical protein